MTPKLKVRAQGPIGYWVDMKIEVIMRFISGASHEAPQRTHFWNNHHLTENEMSHLRPEWMVAHAGNPRAKKIPPIPIIAGALAHATRYGGWSHYLVLKPGTKHEWHIGWRWSGGGGVSRIKTKGPVRVLIGPGPVEWFGIEADTYSQIPILTTGAGYIGDNGSFAQTPLF